MDRHCTATCAKRHDRMPSRRSRPWRLRCRPWRRTPTCAKRSWRRSANWSPRPARRASRAANGIVGGDVSPYNHRMLDQPQLPVAQRTNPERSFTEEVRALRLGQGEIFRGEGILAVTKAILQAGVAYVGGYQGAPVSHLVDVLVESQDLLDELGVHLETCTNESSAAALLGASINYPIRGCVTWKSIVGTRSE